MAIHPRLLTALPAVGIVLIAGDIRSGKSVLAYGIADDLHELYPRRPVHVFGFPQEKVALLPPWITPVHDPEFPDGCIVVADEAYKSFHSRESMSDPNKFIDLFSGLVGQKEILTIYITQTTRKLEVGLVSGAQVFLLKKPSRLMTLLDRSTLRPLLTKAFESFLASKVLPQECTYVVADAFEGFLEHSNSPPPFWSEDLSKAWRGVSIAERYEEPDEEEVRQVRQQTYQVLFRLLAASLLERERPEIKRAISALDPEQPLNPEALQSLQACLPYVGRQARELIRGLN